jgi:hypothetical protein
MYQTAGTGLSFGEITWGSGYPVLGCISAICGHKQAAGRNACPTSLLSAAHYRIDALRPVFYPPLAGDPQPLAKQRQYKRRIMT